MYNFWLDRRGNIPKWKVEDLVKVRNEDFCFKVDSITEEMHYDPYCKSLELVYFYWSDTVKYYGHITCLAEFCLEDANE